MKVRVKIEEAGRAAVIENINIDEQLTIGRLFDDFIMKGHVLEQQVYQLELGSLSYNSLHRQKVQEIIRTHPGCRFLSDSLKITLMNSENSRGARPLLDYSLFLETAAQYCKPENIHHIENGAVCYIQQEHAQFLVRKENHGLEFFHFRHQFDSALESRGRAPFLHIELKTRDELSHDELTWIRSVTLPKTERRNPLIHLNGASLDQDLLMEISTLLHRVIVIIGTYQKAGQKVARDYCVFPAYIEMNGKTTVGRLDRRSLEEIIPDPAE